MDGLAAILRQSRLLSRGRQALIFVPLFVGGIWLGGKFEYSGVSMWLIVLLPTAAAIACTVRPRTCLGPVAVGGVRNFMLVLAAALALMTLANQSNREALSLDGAADRLAAAYRANPAGAEARLRGKSDAELQSLSGRLPDLIEPELKRRREAADAAEKERLRKRERWQQSPIGWISGFIGWMLNPTH